VLTRATSLSPTEALQLYCEALRAIDSVGYGTTGSDS